MDCRSVINLIEELTDPRDPGALPGAHLATCSSCSRLYSERVRLFELVRDSGSVSLPPSFDRQVWARLNEVPAKRRKDSIAVPAQWRLGRVLAFGVLALSICGLFVVFRAQSGASAGDVAIHKATEIGRLSAWSFLRISSAEGPEQTPSDSVVSAQAKELKGSKNRVKVSAPNRIGQPLRGTVAANYALRAAGVRAVDVEDGTSDMIFAAQSVKVPVYRGELKVAVSDGGGNQKTLAVLPVTFGSQKILSNKESRYVPVTDQGIW